MCVCVCGCLTLVPLESHPSPTAGQLLQHSLFRERLLRNCCICMEDLPLSSGLECGRGGHFTCSGCLEQHVLAFSKADVRTLHKAEAKVLFLAVLFYLSLSLSFFLSLSSPLPTSSPTPPFLPFPLSVLLH
jgi:hypothetical protein